ncbi:MAG: ribonuclease catalytic domain-containing protein [bacterium]|nr:ribonuclease catalytic domain-containing protein [bacterium]
MKLFPANSSRSNPDTSFSDGSIVIYENNSNLILGVVLGSKKDKYRILNNKGSEIDLSSDRLYSLAGRIPINIEKSSLKAKFLDDLLSKASVAKNEINLETVWESFEGQESEVSTQEVCELFFGKIDLDSHLAIRLTLQDDKTYFKRRKDTFIARSKEAVTSMIEAQEAESKKERQQNELIECFAQKLKDNSIPFSIAALNWIPLIEALAAESTEGPETKESKDLINLIAERLNLSLPGRPDDKAFELLKAVGHFNERTNLAFYRYNPRIEFSQDVIKESASLEFKSKDLNSEVRKDLTQLFVFTIDDITTKDMDDALSIEQTDTGFTLGIHITDVASSLDINSQTEREAKARATSVYCPEMTIHMLPTSLSQEHLSLKQGEIRPCLSYMIELNSEFEILKTNFYVSNIKVGKRYNYDELDQLFISNQSPNFTSQEITALKTLQEISNKFEVDRIDQGAIRVDRKDVFVQVKDQAKLTLGEFDEGSPARTLVGEMMIFANHLSAKFAKDNNLPIIFRTQPDSDVDPFSNPNNVPVGPAYDYLVRSRLKRSSITTISSNHSSLGLSLYTQVTSPIRRYLDLVVQRQLVNFILKAEPFYSKQELEDIIIETEVPLSSARYLSQESKRFWLLKYLQQELKNIPTIGATVIRTDLKNPIVQLDIIFITVQVSLNRKVSPGDKLKFKINILDPKRDFIRLEEVLS